MFQNSNSLLKFSHILIIGLFQLSMFQVARANVWTEKNTWSPTWEKAYEVWVLSDWKVDVFARKNLPTGEANPFFGLRTDCADTVYSMRIIFAYENSLPFVAVDPTGGQTLISNRMNRWNSIPNEKSRVREFLLFAYDTFSTHSLPADTYPVAISRETVHAGGLMLTTAKNHHSWTIQSILTIGVPHLIFNSTVGAGTGSMLQERTSWPNPEWVFEGQYSPAGHAGLRYWRQHSDLQKPEWEVQGYSDEQYKIPISKWIDVVQGKLAIVNETEPQKIQRLIESVCAGVQGRVAVVKEGVNYLRQVGGRCLNYEEYDTYSSPNRDRRVFDDLLALRQAYRSIDANQKLDTLSVKVLDQLRKIFPFIREPVQVEQRKMSPSKITADSICIVTYASSSAQDRQIDLAEYRRRSFEGLLSNNPNESFEQRWGELRGRPNSCKTWDVWTPQFSMGQ